jgi:hypothetical protein
MYPERQSGLVIVHTTWFVHEAEIARARLEADGLDAWVLDAEQVGVQWHVAGAIGGVKVAVWPEDAARARVLLAEDRSDVLDDLDEAEAPEAASERCERCGAAALRAERVGALPSAGGWLTMAIFFAAGLLVPLRRRYEMRSCGACGARNRVAISTR